MSSTESHHARKARRAAEQALLATNEHARVNIREHGRLTSHVAHGAIAAGEVLAHIVGEQARRAAAAPPTPKTNPKPARATPRRAASKVKSRRPTGRKVAARKAGRKKR